MRPALLAALLCCLSAAVCAETPNIFIFDVVHRPAYRAAYVKMLVGQHGLPRWMATPDTAGDGTATPGKLAKIKNDDLEVFVFCEPHNCGGHHFAVGFTQFGEVAKGALAIDGKVRFFGRPNTEEAKVLAAAATADD